MDYLEIIKDTSNPTKIKQLFESKRPVFEVTQTEAISQFKVSEHDVFDEQKRPKKKIKKDIGEKDANGAPKLVNAEVEVARIGMPFQSLIVNRRVGFMLTNPVETSVIYDTEDEKEKNLVKLIDKIQNDNKMDYKNKEIARRLMSEMECAELWYLVENDNRKWYQKLFGIAPKYTLKVKIASPDLGDILYPLFDDTGDMVAFGRYYKKKLDDNKDKEFLDVYTTEFEYKYSTVNGEWLLDPDIKVNPIPNLVKKIMVVYYTQPQPEWSDVQSMISRHEYITSNHADMNDYFGSPILTVAGDILGFAQKGEQGKILQLAAEAKANYLALNSSPESIKTEQDNLTKYIYSMTQTPNIAFEELKGSIGNISGIALKLLFLDCHMAVAMKEEIFGIGLQRRLNLIKATIGAVINTSMSELVDTVQLKPEITPYLPQNDTELVDNLSVSVTAGMMSKETAVEKNPLIEDSEAELSRLQNDVTSEISQPATV